jgi:hypothetical protein
VEREGPLPVPVAVGYVLEACEAIAAAHAMRIVHRDLKPSNLFLARRPGQKPIVKVLDFGISKVMDEEVSLTKTSSGLGSALYMAPEQMRNAKSCDERADLWALGIILYELLAGVPPYDGESVHEVVANVLEQNRVKLSDRLPSVPPELDALVEECLVLDPKKRIASVAHVAERIAPFGPPGSAESVDRVRALLGVLPSETARLARSGHAALVAAGRRRDRHREDRRAPRCAHVGRAPAVGEWSARARGSPCFPGDRGRRGRPRAAPPRGGRGFSRAHVGDVGRGHRSPVRHERAGLGRAHALRRRALRVDREPAGGRERAAQEDRQTRAGRGRCVHVAPTRLGASAHVAPHRAGHGWDRPDLDHGHQVSERPRAPARGIA